MTPLHSRKRIVQAVCAALLPVAAIAQGEGETIARADAETEEHADTVPALRDGSESHLDRVLITGSRIKRTSVESVEPLQVFTAEDLRIQGYANLYDTLANLTVNTAPFAGEEITNNFNANAQALNLRGFGPGYTLVLLNGRRIPMLPKPSGPVAGNVTNLATIPTSAIERVEVLTSGASAIYGSDAVAGVVNIILKNKFQGSEFSYRHGDTRHGGGRSDRATMVSGLEWIDTGLSFGLELDRRRPIHGDQRRWFADPQRSPDPTRRELSQVMSYWDRASGWEILDIGERCSELGYTAVRPGWAGPGDERYCGDNVFGTYTVRNGRDRLFGFANLHHPLGQHELYANVLASHSRADAGLYRYSFGADYEIVDDIHADQPQALGWRHLWRSFREYEVPTSQQRFKEDNIVFGTGLRGYLGDFDYGLHYSHGRYRYRDTVGRFNDHAMLGLLFGTEGIDWVQPWAGSRWLRVNRSQLDQHWLPSAGLGLFGVLTPEQFEAALHTSVGAGHSSTQALSADLAGTLFELPAGGLDFALVTEAHRGRYHFLTDQPTVDGEIYGWSGIRGRGERNHYAVGGEVALPLTAAGSGVGQFDARLAARYDYYDDASDVGGAPTWQAGLSWRPIDALLLRVSLGTSFRAPDMHVMFAERSSSFTSGIDYLRCVTEEGLAPGDSWQGCGENYGTGSIRQFSQGEPSLREETGRSFSAGMAAQLGDHHFFTADYFRIRLDHQIGLIDAHTVLRYAAECVLGFDQNGNSVDGGSPRCQEMLRRVVRGDGPGSGVTSVITSPFNTGMRRQDGIDVVWQSSLPTAAYGEFSARLGYTHIFKTLSRYLPEDEIENIRDRQWNREFRTRSTLTLGWHHGRVFASTHVNRLGSSPARYAEQGVRMPAWTTVNLSMNYRLAASLDLGLNVVNVFDKKPHRHDSELWWPYADIVKYDPGGTEYFLSAVYRF